MSRPRRKTTPYRGPPYWRSAYKIRCGARVQGNCPKTADSVNEIVALMNRSIENARSLSRELLRVRIQSGSFVGALRELVAPRRALYGLDVNFTAQGALEALTNASRHGQATPGRHPPEANRGQVFALYYSQW